jgi:hypothetical protein
LSPAPTRGSIRGEGECRLRSRAGYPESPAARLARYRAALEAQRIAALYPAMATARIRPRTAFPVTTTRRRHGCSPSRVIPLKRSRTCATFRAGKRANRGLLRPTSHSGDRGFISAPEPIHRRLLGSDPPGSRYGGWAHDRILPELISAVKPRRIAPSKRYPDCHRQATIRPLSDCSASQIFGQCRSCTAPPNIRLGSRGIVRVRSSLVITVT